MPHDRDLLLMYQLYFQEDEDIKKARKQIFINKKQDNSNKNFQVIPFETGFDLDT